MTADKVRQYVGHALHEVRRYLREATASPARLLTDEQRQACETEIYEGAHLTPAYGFMLFSACGIAALGLLQSSVAVVIGAMLISPLMGPIMAMGMSLARLRPRAFKSAAITLAIGALLSVAASVLIVWASPLKDATSEILARTRPTLLDLIVALLSGFVGAYLTINRKGGAIAGVAIATALMPPLAVVGYGIATAAWNIAGGALLLFMTNVVAILAAVFGVARRYGFRPIYRQGRAWEVFALLGVTALLCVPLAVSLRGIVVEARETTRVRSAIAEAFSGGSPHIAELVVETRGGDATGVQCVVVTRRYFPGAVADVARHLPPGAQVDIEQVVTATGSPPTPTSALANRVAPVVTAPTAEQRLRTMLSGVGRVLSVTATEDHFTVNMTLNGATSLADYRAVEQAATRFVPGATVHIVPPLAPLPEIQFARGTSQLSPEGEETVDLIAWALERWSLSEAEVEGRASPSARGRRQNDIRMAQARADAVAERLRAAGLATVATSTAVPKRIDGDETPYLSAKVSARAAPIAPPDGAGSTERKGVQGGSSTS